MQTAQKTDYKGSAFGEQHSLNKVEDDYKHADIALNKRFSE